MKKLRLSLMAAALALFVAANAQAIADFPDPESISELRNVPPIFIMNERTEIWSIKVWAYAGTASGPDLWSCQTLDYFADYSKAIEPWRVRDPFAALARNHCGNYDSLTFWFRVWNRQTGEVRDYTTFGRPARWGARWRWDGSAWTCTNCE